ncbi:cytochrome P450 [Roseomonas sp. BN140053]|uniref:cytochrome P450 n=1 Tax=Roseomonas sp. BN140053 TaxID=3391898 RepID=UPI0039E81E15
MSEATVLPAGAALPVAPLSPLRLLRTVLRNPMEAIPAATLTEPIVQQGVFSYRRVFVMAPELVGQVLTAEADAFVKAEAMQRALKPALGEAILTADGERWRWQRRAAAPIFRHERILGFLPEMLTAAGRTRDRWLALPAGQPVDLGHEMMRTTFDIIVDTMLSGRGDIDVDRVEQGITDYLGATSWAIALAMLHAPAWTPHPGRRRAERARDYLRDELLRLATARRGADPAGHGPEGEERRDLISLLLQAQDPDTGQAMDDQDVADNLLTFITAGHETTALALAWSFYLLALHPAVEARVLAEIAAVTGGGPLRPDHVPALTYVRQVIQEAMRLYPPAPIVARTAQRDVRLGDLPVRAGTPVYIPVYSVHRHRTLWEEPDRFDPDRFRPELAKARHRYAFLPFGAGPRICIGASFATLEAVAILATLLPALRLSLAGNTAPGLQMRITLRPSPGLLMLPARRAA